MFEFSTVGIDLAKNVIQAHGVDADGKAVLRRQLRRNQFLSFFVTSRKVVWLLPEQLRLEFVPVLHRLQGRLAAEG